MTDIASLATLQIQAFLLALCRQLARAFSLAPVISMMARIPGQNVLALHQIGLAHAD